MRISEKVVNNFSFSILICLILLFVLKNPKPEQLNNPNNHIWNNVANTNAEKPVPQPIPAEDKIYSNYNEALNASKASKKDIFVFFHADWCGYCTKMMKTTLVEEKTKTSLKNFIVLYVDSDQYPSIAKKFKTKVLPTYFLIDNTESVKKTGEGFKSSDEFIKWLSTRAEIVF